MTPLAAGVAVPEFRLARADRTAFTVDDLRGHTTALVFYPFAFSPVCTEQLKVYDDARAQFGEAVVYGVSCDASPSQVAFAASLDIEIEQLSDFEPKGAASSVFGVLHPGGFCERALVVVGPDAAVRWSYLADSPGDLPPVELLLEGLSA